MSKTVLIELSQLEFAALEVAASSRGLPPRLLIKELILDAGIAAIGGNAEKARQYRQEKQVALPTAP